MTPMVGKYTVGSTQPRQGMLNQAKQQQSRKIHNELEICSLLRNGDLGTRLLQGLIQLCRGNLNSDRNTCGKGTMLVGEQSRTSLVQIFSREYNLATSAGGRLCKVRCCHRKRQFRKEKSLSISDAIKITLIQSTN